MSYTIADLKVDLARKLQGVTLDQVEGVDTLIEEAGRDILADYDAPETKRLSTLTNPIYDDVYTYQLPSDLKGDKIVDIYRQANGTTEVMQVATNDFREDKTNNTFNVFYNDAGKTLKISKNVGKNANLSTLNTTTDWLAGNDAFNLTSDTLNYISGGSSLKFDLSGVGTDGYLEATALDSVDMSDYEDEGAGFLYVYLPDSSIITSIDLRWGDDSANHWNRTVTTTHEGLAFEDGWNLLRFDWNGATETGTPDSSSVNYSRITINYDGTADTDLRVDSLVFRLGSLFKIYYYSNYLFRTSAGVWQEGVSDDTNIVNLETDSYNLLLSRAYYLASLQIANGNSNFNIEGGLTEYTTLLMKLKNKYKSEAQKRISYYYKV